MCPADRFCLNHGQAVPTYSNLHDRGKPLSTATQLGSARLDCAGCCRQLPTLFAPAGWHSSVAAPSSTTILSVAGDIASHHNSYQDEGL